MNPAKAAALLNGGIQKFVRGFGKPELTASDVAAACAQIKSDGARLLGRVKWAGQESLTEVLVQHLKLDMLLKYPHWITEQAELEKVCHLAVKEIVTPPLCHECGGRGEKMVAPGRKRGRPGKGKKVLKEICAVCGGSGIRQRRQFSLSTAAKIGRRRWNSTWAGRYKDVVSKEVYDYESIFFDELKKYLR